MNNELIQLAEEKGFNNSFVVHDNYGHLLSAEVQYLFWMTALQKWLREVHKIHISLHFNKGASWAYIVLELSYDGSWTKDYPERSYESFEIALEVGLHNALKLIK